MLEKVRKLAADTLTRKKIEHAVMEFATNYCNGGPVYDIGGVSRYSYEKYFSDYKTINCDRKEKPDVFAYAERLPFKGNTVSNILCLAMLEHVRDPGEVLDEMYRVMKRGAHALIWIPFYWREHNYPIDNTRYTKQGINALIEKHGFKVVKSDCKPYNGLFFILSHNVRFLMTDPHNVKSYDPLLYLHAGLCYMSKLDSILNLEYPYIYTGVEVIMVKKNDIRD